MVALATAQQVSALSEGAIPVNRPGLDLELDAASKLIRDACGWHVYPLEEHTTVRRSQFWSAIWVPAMHIRSVTILDRYGVLTVLDPEEFDPMTGWTAWSGDRYTLTYEAGLETVPADLVKLTAQIASRALSSPSGAVREQTLASSVTWSTVAPGVAGGAVLLEHEKNALAAYQLGRLA